MRVEVVVRRKLGEQQRRHGPETGVGARGDGRFYIFIHVRDVADQVKAAGGARDAIVDEVAQIGNATA